MTLIFADGFESGTTPWVLSNVAIGTGRFGNGLTTPSVATGSATIGIGTFPISTPMIIGFAVKPAGTLTLFHVLSASASIHLGLFRTASGSIDAFRSGVATVLGSSAAGVLPVGAWSYVECKFTQHDTAGIVIVKVNGIEVLNLSSVDTRNVETTFDQIRFGGILSNAAGSAWDDFYVCDNTGSVNNDFLGELMVEHLIPGSDDTAQWTGSDGNSTANYDLVNETGAYNSSDYVATSTVGQRDLYIPVTSSRPITSPVKGVIVSAIAQKTDAGTRTAKLIIKEGAGGTERLSPELGLPTSFGELKATWDRKADGSAWTVADVNALRFGIEVVS